jgi:hypothetical protein
MQGKYRSVAGTILPDKINVLFTDTPFLWIIDRLLVEQYAAALHQVVHQVLADQEAILIAAYPVYHVT